MVMPRGYSLRSGRHERGPLGSIAVVISHGTVIHSQARRKVKGVVKSAQCVSLKVAAFIQHHHHN
jgi:hypothetical protein